MQDNICAKCGRVTATQFGHMRIHTHGYKCSVRSEYLAEEAVVVNTTNDSLHVEKWYGSIGAAKAALKTTARFKDTRYTFEALTESEFSERNVDVDTYNLLDPERRPIKIRKCYLGTASDPATERYHSM